MFALPWYLTWFGHSLNQYRDVVRLYDYFLASPPLMPLYVTVSLVIERRQEVFETGCDMASIHCLLSQIPDDLDFEGILKRASFLYSKHAPEKLEKDVKKRVQREYVFFGLPYFVHRLLDVFKSLFCLRFIFGLICFHMLGKRKYKHN